MIVGLCFIVLEVFCMIAILFFFGRLTGLFADESSAAICASQYRNSVNGIFNNFTCPFGIDLNSFNFPRLHR